MRSNAQIQLQCIAAALYPVLRLLAFLWLPLYFMRFEAYGFSLAELIIFAISLVFIFCPNLIRWPKLTPEEVEAEIRRKYRITCYEGIEYRIEKFFKMSETGYDKRGWEWVGKFSCFKDAYSALEEMIGTELRQKLYQDPQNWEVVE